MDIIVAVFSGSVAQVDDSVARASSVSGYIVGVDWCHLAVPYLKKIVMHIDSRIFVTDANAGRWTEIVCVGVPINNNESKLIAYGDKVAAITLNGVFMIDLSAGIYYRQNESLSIDSWPVSDPGEGDYVYRYILTAIRMVGTGDDVSDRRDFGNKTEIESPPLKPAGSDKDYFEVRQDRPIGAVGTTYARVEGSVLSDTYKDPATWTAKGVGQFTMSINGVAYIVYCDFSDISKMNDVALEVQTALRDYNNYITCIFDGDKFVIEVPTEGSSLSLATGTDTDPDTFVDLALDDGTVYNLDYYTGIDLGDLPLPVSSSGSVPEQFTGWRLYRTLDVGNNGIDNTTKEANSTEMYVWVADIPFVHVVEVSSSGDNLGAVEGSFLQGEAGNDFLIDGSSTFVTWIDSGTVEMESPVVVSNAPAVIYRNDASGIYLFRARQYGKIVEVDSRVTLNSGFIGKVIHWSGGGMSVVSSVESASKCAVVETGNRDWVSAAIGYSERNWVDYLPDDDLASRVAAWPLRSRFMASLPYNNPVGDYSGGVLAVCELGGSRISYSSAPYGFEYLFGYYNEVLQTVYVRDKIQRIDAVKDGLLVIGSGSRYLPTNVFRQDYGVGDVTLVLSSIYDIDETIGIADRSHACKIPGNALWMITTEPGIRIFNGVGFGDNLALDRVVNMLRVNIDKPASVFYSPEIGVSFYFYDNVVGGGLSVNDTGGVLVNNTGVSRG